MSNGGLARVSRGPFRSAREEPRRAGGDGPSEARSREPAGSRTRIENNGGSPRAESVNGGATRTTPSAASARDFLATLTKDEAILDDVDFVEKVSRGLKRSGEEAGATERIRNALSALE